MSRAALERGAAVAAAAEAAAISINFCGVLHSKCRRALNESLTPRYVSALDDNDAIANLNQTTHILCPPRLWYT